MPMMFPIQTKMFQSTYLYKVRHKRQKRAIAAQSFNPRTYIRYDSRRRACIIRRLEFQSTYLYKVRLHYK